MLKKLNNCLRNLLYDYIHNFESCPDETEQVLKMFENKTDNIISDNVSEI